MSHGNLPIGVLALTAGPAERPQLQPGTHICITSTTAPEIGRLLGTADLASALRSSIGETLRRIAPALADKAADGNPRIFAQARPTLCADDGTNLLVDLTVADGARAGAYVMTVQARQGAARLSFTVDRPTGERPDVLPLTGAPPSAYVTQSISMDVRELGTQIAQAIQNQGGRP